MRVRAALKPRDECRHGTAPTLLSLTIVLLLDMVYARPGELVLARTPLLPAGGTQPVITPPRPQENQQAASTTSSAKIVP